LHVTATLDKISGTLNNTGVWEGLLVVGAPQLTVRPSNQIARWSRADHVIDWLVFRYFGILVFFIIYWKIAGSTILKTAIKKTFYTVYNKTGPNGTRIFYKIRKTAIIILVYRVLN